MLESGVDTVQCQVTVRHDGMLCRTGDSELARPKEELKEHASIRGGHSTVLSHCST
jgi:hypothetical protein